MILQMDNFSTILFALKLCIQFSILNSHHLNQSNLVTKKVLSINFIDLYLSKLEIYLTYSVHIKMFNSFYNAFNYGRSRNCNE
ncbi:hypothetical protein EIH03_03775 [Staphylococcus aureus]|uniref:Uncharacterized protein n=1 Tax=Staphylococcus aureus TaxID=1280 RepID=A0AB37XWR6_STAAU|nr:hypothetical protein EIH03_03775 [Staphylococcus aureus]